MKTEQQKTMKHQLWDISNASYFAQYIVENEKEMSKTRKKMILNRLKKIREIENEIEILIQQ